MQHNPTQAAAESAADPAEGGWTYQLVQAAGELVLAHPVPTLGGALAVLAVLYGLGERSLETKAAEGKKVKRRTGSNGAADAVGEGIAVLIGGVCRAVWRLLTGRPLWGAETDGATWWRPAPPPAADPLAAPSTLGSVAVAGPAPEPIDWAALGKRAAASLGDAAWIASTVRVLGTAATAVGRSVRTVARGLGAWKRWRRAGRAAARVAALAAVAGLVLWPVPTVAALAVGAVAVLVVAGMWGEGYRLTPEQEFGPALWPAMVQVLALSAEEQELGMAHWIKWPARLEDEDARLVVRLPLRWIATDKTRAIMSEVLHSRVPGEWVARYHQRGPVGYAEWSPKPKPKPKPELPTYVRWEPTGDPYKTHYGQTHDGPAFILTKNATPHIGVSGETGAGKSTIAYISLVSARLAGWLVTVIDPKQNSLVEAQGKSGVRYVTETYECVMAIAEYFTSMIAAEKYNSRAYRGRKHGDVAPIPRLLIIDELPSFRDFVAAWWKFIVKERGFPPVLVWFQIILMQGRSSDHRVFVGTHQYALEVFGSTMARDQVGTKLVVGETSDPSWMVAYGQTTPRLNFDDTIKGRGVISTKGRKKKKVSEDGIPERVEEIQFAYLEDEEINAYLDRAPRAPGWFDGGEMAPWITPEDLEKADSAGAVKEFMPGGAYDPLTPDTDTASETTRGDKSRSETRKRVSASEDETGRPLAELVQEMAEAEPEPIRYTLRQACEAGVIERGYGAARQAKSDALAAGKPFPEGKKIKNITYYTAEELQEFYGAPKESTESE